MKSDYTYALKDLHGRNVISITDLDKGGRTVTTNIINVIREIGTAEKINPEQYMIVYRDTEHTWDGYDFKNKVFVPLCKRTEDEAIRKYIEKQLTPNRK